MTIHLELTYDIEEHIPIRVISSGRSLEALLENAEYCVDCPDPKQFYPIDHLSTRSWNAVSDLIESAWREKMGAGNGP